MIAASFAKMCFVERELLEAFKRSTVPRIPKSDVGF